MKLSDKYNPRVWLRDWLNKLTSTEIAAHEETMAKMKESFKKHREAESISLRANSVRRHQRITELRNQKIRAQSALSEKSQPSPTPATPTQCGHFLVGIGIHPPS